MSTLLLITIFIVAIIMTFVFLCIYLKLLSVIANKLNYSFHKTGEARGNTRQDSRIEVCCIYCFDKSHDFLNTHVFRRVCRVIKYFIRHKPISDNSCNGYNECSREYHNTDVESSLPEHRIKHSKKLGRPQGSKARLG